MHAGMTWQQTPPLYRLAMERGPGGEASCQLDSLPGQAYSVVEPFNCPFSGGGTRLASPYGLSSVAGRRPAMAVTTRRQYLGISAALSWRAAACDVFGPTDEGVISTAEPTAPAEPRLRVPANSRVAQSDQAARHAWVLDFETVAQHKVTVRSLRSPGNSGIFPRW